MAAVLAAGAEGVPKNQNVSSQELVATGHDGAAEVAVRAYRPVGVKGTLPGLLYIHGGGMVLGSVDMADRSAVFLTDLVGCVTVSVEYRLAPEHPFPDAPEDCYTALVWMAGNAAELGVDPARIAVYGASAGGGLAIAISLMARDRGGPAICMQMPIYPMIDDRNITASSHEITDVGIWDRSGNIEAWAMYLGASEGDSVSEYAAPARASDLSGLPPTFIDVGDVDMFRDEDIEFAARLMRAGVPTELHVNPGAYHAAEVFAPNAAMSKRIWAMRVDALKRGFNK